MKRKNFMMAFVSLFTVVALCSCGKDDDGDEGDIPTSEIADNTITATVENGSSYNNKIDSVIMSMNDYGDIKKSAVAIAPYSNGGFTLKLSATVSDTNLDPFEDDDFSAGVKVSNPNVKTGIAWIFAYNQSGENIGEFEYRTSDGNLESSLIYSNGDVSITGSESYEDGEVENYSIHLKKGWNRVYFKESKINGKEVYESTTQAPSGLKWYYEEYTPYTPESSVSKKVSTLLSKRKARL
jgi:hypothetical protein